MTIETIPVGMLKANCYFVTQNEKTIIIDPGDEFEKILKCSKGKNIVGILVTHHHFDHITALEKVEHHFHLTHNPKNIEGFSFQVISTPGHSSDSISFYFEKENILFSGDFIFYHSIGRWDFETGNKKEMQTSIKKIINYPKNMKIYPGHGISTILQDELPFLNLYI